MKLLYFIAPVVNSVFLVNSHDNIRTNHSFKNLSIIHKKTIAKGDRSNLFDDMTSIKSLE